ncbi:hypothetical protein [Sinorhizobium fredii]|uniref:hypothetical protein n=1 Tax=Rhizobium fredii TaxID=380 RepID=UPI003511F2CF
MSEDDDRPTLTVVADNPQPKRNERLAQQYFNDALLQLAANIIRVVRGAGKPYELILQCNDVVTTAIEVRDATGNMPSDATVANLLLLEREEIEDYHSFRGGKKLAMHRMVKGGLQFAASRLLHQQLQIQQGEREMEDAFDELERLHEERRKQREAEARADRAKALPKRKPAKRKPRKPKSEGFL